MKKTALVLTFIFLLLASPALADEKFFYKEKTDDGMIMIKYFSRDPKGKGNGAGDETSPTPAPTTSPEPTTDPSPSADPSESPDPSPTSSPSGDPSPTADPTQSPDGSPTATPTSTPEVSSIDIGTEVDTTVTGIRALINQLIEFILGLL